MRSLDWPDLIGGLLLILVGGFFAIQAGEYDLGTLRRMGPGFFPRALGLLLIAIGALIALPSLVRKGEMPRPSVRPFVTILLAIVAFAVSVERIGMVPATFLLVALSSLAGGGARPLPTLLLAVALSLIAVLVFSWGLGIPLQAFAWPF